MILVCGEALIDLFACAGQQRGYQLTASVGGSSLNVASAARRMGIPTAFLGGISTDHFGRALMETLRAENIDTTFVKRTSRPTPLVLAVPDRFGHPTYTFYARGTADQSLSAEDLPPQLLPSTSTIVLGSYTLVTEPTAGAWLTLAERYSQELVISLDPNVRSTLISSPAGWRTRMDVFARRASIVKMSDEDFNSGWGPSAGKEHLVRRWMSYGVRLIVMTHGSEGATAWWRGGCVQCPGRKVRVRDAIGAGDTFHAALLARLAQLNRLGYSSLDTLDEPTVADAVRYGIIASSITCTRRGGDAPTRAEVDAARLRGDVDD